MRKYCLLTMLLLVLLVSSAPAAIAASPPSPMVQIFGVSHYQNVVVQIGFPHPNTFVRFLSFPVKGATVKVGKDAHYFFQLSLPRDLFSSEKVVRLISPGGIVLSNEYTITQEQDSPYLFMYGLGQG